MIGKKIWRFDINRRVYPEKESGELYASGGPIWKKHWVEWEVVGETSRSWLVGRTWDPWKIPKKGPLPHGWCWDEAEIDRMAWIEENQYKISDAVRHGLSFDQLTRIAQIIGYPTSPTSSPVPPQTNGNRTFRGYLATYDH